MIRYKKIISYAIILAIIPAIIVLGAFIFKSKMYLWIGLCVAVFSCVPFFLAYEKGRASSQRITLVAIMTALGIAGRLIFAIVPHFKPVAAIVQITGIFLGAQSGFVCGALSALISNIAFGQGPWTPFQMLAWGLTGFFGGVFASSLKKHRSLNYLLGALCGIMYSLIMDVWSILLYGGSESSLLTLLIASLPIMLIYAVSNIIFLALFTRPIGDKLERIKLKYGIEIDDTE